MIANSACVKALDEDYKGKFDFNVLVKVFRRDVIKFFETKYINNPNEYYVQATARILYILTDARLNQPAQFFLFHYENQHLLQLLNALLNLAQKVVTKFVMIIEDFENN